jgi:phage regulator Rha-like protein
MTDIITVQPNSTGELVVDSRLVAEELDINHKSFLQTIRKHQTQLEQAFGVLAFQTAKPQDSTGGRPETFALLTEPQAIALMTFSRNTERVVQCKIHLVKAFEYAKSKLEQSVKHPVPEDRQIAPRRDSVDFIEAADKLSRLRVNEQLKRLLEDALVDDLSLAKTSQGLLPPSAAEAQDGYTMVKVRARELGYSLKDIGSGASLGKFVAKRIKKTFRFRVGDYMVNHYQVCEELDAVIHEYFAR